VIATCDACLARTWLLARLSGHLDLVRARVSELLELAAGELVDALAGTERDAVARELARFDAEAAREAAVDAGLSLICRCQQRYPPALADLPAPPAVLHIAGEVDQLRALCAGDPVAVIGARGASDYGREMARALGRGLGAAGITVVSGLARGADAAAHDGALAGGGATLAVLPGSAHRPYPRSHRKLHAAIVDTGAALSELPPGTGVRRWMFLARNRIIAGLARMTVVVEAGEQSGALVTAEVARRLGRAVGAVPGRTTTPQASGSNALLADGAVVVRNAQDVLDTLFGAGTRQTPPDERPPLNGMQAHLIAALADGQALAAALASSGIDADRGLAAVAELELAGWVRRGPGGRFTVVP
jgi:DNA processing protein